MTNPPRGFPGSMWDAFKKWDASSQPESLPPVQSGSHDLLPQYPSYDSGSKVINVPGATIGNLTNATFGLANYLPNILALPEDLLRAAGATDNDIDGLYFAQMMAGPGAIMAAVEGLGNLPGMTRSLLAAEDGALRFSQTTANAEFSEAGAFAGETIGSVAAKLKAGAVSPADVPVRYVTIGSNNLIVNTRSALALTRAGIPQTSWRLLDASATDAADIEIRLLRNDLTAEGTDVLRITGAGRTASSLRQTMIKTLWQLPVPSTALLGGGPVLETRPRREVALLMSYETDEGERVAELAFEGVEAFRVTYYRARGDWMLEAYDRLMDLGQTAWLSEISDNLRQHDGDTNGLSHMSINFDDGPCYEVICRSHHLKLATK